MVTTNCRELTGEGDCTIPISGNNVQELQQNVLKHVQQHHADKAKSMSQQDQTRMAQRIQEIYSQKAGIAAAR